MKILAIYSAKGGVEKRKTMHSLFLDEYGSHPLFLSTRIPFMAEIEKMGLFRSPVGGDGKTSPAAEQYKRVWLEILERGDEL